MPEDYLSETTQLIARDFELEGTAELVTEEELFNMLANRVAWLIEHRMEYLLSLMYRMDVSEDKVNFALSPQSPEPANVAIARLVLDRQKERIRTKREYRQDKLDDWDW